MQEPFPWIADKLGALTERGLLRERRTIERLPDGWCQAEGRRLRDFASNDYLGLSHDPRVIDATRSATADSGAGSGASPLVVGRSPWHERLERRLAEFEGAEGTVLFPTGFAANVGTIAALVDREDAIFSDRLNHASLIDGCRQSGAIVHIYDHDRLDDLEDRLAKERRARRKLIVTDGVFSMDGLLAPLSQLCNLARQHSAEILVDEAHATGVLGERGRGVAELLKVEREVSVRVGTLSKAIGSVGGFVAGNRRLVDWLWNRARTQVYSTAAPPAACAAACTALDIIESEPARREHLLELSAQLRQRINDLGLQTPPNGIGPIVPVLLHDPELAVSVARRLELDGFLVGAIRPPSVPEGTSRLRISVMAVHDEHDIMALLGSLEKATASEMAARG